jgi:hypothetical protein
LKEDKYDALSLHVYCSLHSLCVAELSAQTANTYHLKLMSAHLSHYPLTFNIRAADMRAVLFVAAIFASALLLPGAHCDVDKLYSIDRSKLLHNERDVWFDSLTERELVDRWSHDDGSSVAQKLQTLKTLTPTTVVDVVLVGFTGDGAEALAISEDELMRYLDALPVSSAIHVSGERAAARSPFVSPLAAATAAAANRGDKQTTTTTTTTTTTSTSAHTHTLPFGNAPLFRVTIASPDVAASIATAINDWIADHFDPATTQTTPTQTTTTTATGGGGGGDVAVAMEVPVTVVDGIIAAHYDAKALSNALYILNPTYARVSDGGGGGGGGGFGSTTMGGGGGGGGSGIGGGGGNSGGRVIEYAYVHARTPAAAATADDAGDGDDDVGGGGASFGGDTALKRSVNGATGGRLRCSGGEWVVGDSSARQQLIYIRKQHSLIDLHSQAAIIN